MPCIAHTGGPAGCGSVLLHVSGEKWQLNVSQKLWWHLWASLRGLWHLATATLGAFKFWIYDKLLVLGQHISKFAFLSPSWLCLGLQCRIESLLCRNKGTEHWTLWFSGSGCTWYPHLLWCTSFCVCLSHGKGDMWRNRPPLISQIQTVELSGSCTMHHLHLPRSSTLGSWNLSRRFSPSLWEEIKWTVNIKFPFILLYLLIASLFSAH